MVGMGPDVAAWNDVTLVERVAEGQRNEVWFGESSNGPVAVRRSRRSGASLAWELELIGALDVAGFRVPVVVRTDDGASSHDGVVVQRWLDGRPPSSDEGWRAVGAELSRLHDVFRGWPQRPGCVAAPELGRHGRSVDVDMSALPDEVADVVLGAFRAVGHVEVSVVHGDPGAPNIRIDDDGRVGLLDWDESRVDVVFHDLSELGVQVLYDDDHRRAVRLSHAWEAANAWHLEPEYARNRLKRLQA